MKTTVEFMKTDRVLSFENIQMVCKRSSLLQRFLPMFGFGRENLRLIIPGRIDLRPGITLLVGESGSGKSVFLSLLAGYPLANALVSVGSFCVAGKPAKWLTTRELSAVIFSRGVQRAFKGVPRFFLPQKFPEVTQGGVQVGDVLLLLVDGLLGSECVTRTREEKINCLNDLLVRAGLEDKWKSEFTQLSGGERQRIELLARFAVMKLSNAKQMILLLDEPTTGLDIKNAQKFYVLLNTLLKEVHYASAVIATHDLLTCPQSESYPLIIAKKRCHSEISITQYNSACDFIQVRQSDVRIIWRMVYDRLQEEKDENVAF